MGSYFTRDILQWAGINIGLCLLLAIWWIRAHKHKDSDES